VDAKRAQQHRWPVRSLRCKGIATGFRDANAMTSSALLWEVVELFADGSVLELLTLWQFNSAVVGMRAFYDRAIRKMPHPMHDDYCPIIGHPSDGALQ
jgi:hypothetical protein